MEIQREELKTYEHVFSICFFIYQSYYFFPHSIPSLSFFLKKVFSQNSEFVAPKFFALFSHRSLSTALKKQLQKKQLPCLFFVMATWQLILFRVQEGVPRRGGLGPRHSMRLRPPPPPTVLMSVRQGLKVVSALSLSLLSRISNLRGMDKRTDRQTNGHNNKTHALAMH